MLPAARSDSPSLAHVLTSAVAAVEARDNPLNLRPVRSAAVILVDGLGMSSVRTHSGHARRLLAATPGRSGVLDAGFPTTTAAALATLTTGVTPGEHGIIGYRALDRVNDRVVNQLTGWDDRARPTEWQPHETVFERATRQGIDAVIVGAERYRDTGFTQAVLRGARFEAQRAIADRLAVALELLAESQPRIVYVYVPELDQVGHAQGTASGAWAARLDELDAALAELERALPAGAGVLLTADHGMLDIAEHRRLIISADDELWNGVRHVAGEPRCLHLQVEEPERVAEIRDRWRAAEGARAWVASREEAIAAGWFGQVHADVIDRIGDVVVAARSEVAYYDEREADRKALAMIGQHGSLSDAERRVPLARWGEFAS